MKEKRVMILLELYLSFLKIGLFSFGGGYAMLPLMEKEFIHGHDWLTRAEFIDIIAIAEATPGPVSINSATFIGLNVGGFPGSVLATAGVVTPSLIILLFVTRFLFHFNDLPITRFFFRGVQPAVLSLIALAAILVAETAGLSGQSLLIGLGSFYLIMRTKLHPIAILALGAAGGLLLS